MSGLGEKGGVADENLQKFIQNIIIWIFQNLYCQKDLEFPPTSFFLYLKIIFFKIWCHLTYQASSGARVSVSVNNCRHCSRVVVFSELDLLPDISSSKSLTNRRKQESIGISNGSIKRELQTIKFLLVSAQTDTTESQHQEAHILNFYLNWPQYIYHQLRYLEKCVRFSCSGHYKLIWCF